MIGMVCACSFSHVQKPHVDELLLMAERTLADVSRHEPFIIKDPRLCWTFTFWKALLQRPVCVIMYKDPIVNAINLAENAKSSTSLPPPASYVLSEEEATTLLTFGFWFADVTNYSQMTAQHWLSTWESMTMHALHGCAGVPTVVMSSKQLKSDMHHSVNYLFEALKHAGTHTMLLC